MKKLYTIVAILFMVITVQAQVDRSVMPKPGPAPEINLEEPQRFELKNGLTVMVVENHKLPRVSIQLSIDNPPIAEGDKAGVQALTGSLLGLGSKNISKDDFNEEIDFLGARLNLGAQGGFASSLSKYFPRVLELMADAALNPNFTQVEFDAEKARTLTGLKSQEKDVSAISGRVQTALAYGVDHPNGEYVTEETVNNVTLADLSKFYADYFVPANAYLVVIGDVKFDDVKELVTKNFTAWTKATPPSFQFSKPRDVQYTQISFVDVPNAVQSEVTVQNLVNLKMSDKDYLPSLVANRILGGGGEARLFLNLREDKGYTYGSYSGLGSNKYGPSRFRAFASVRNAVTDSSVVQILSEIDRIVKEPVSEKELKNTKAKYVGNFVLALESPQTIANYALNIETQGLPKDFYKTYLERINAITVNDVQKAAKKHFSSSNARVVIAGKGSEVLENLEKVSFNGKNVPIKYYDKYANATDKPEYKEVAADVSVQSIVNNYFNAIGGKSKVDAVKSVKLVYEGSAFGATIKTEEKRTADKYAAITFQNDNALQGVIAKGDELFMKQGANKIPLPPAMRDDLKKALGVFPEYGFVNNEAAKVSGIEKVEGKDAYKIEVAGETISVSYFYDVATGLKVKESRVINFGGQKQTQETILKDYKEIDGIKFPGIKSSSLQGQPLESKLIEAVINTGVSDADFD